MWSKPDIIPEETFQSIKWMGIITILPTAVQQLTFIPITGILPVSHRGPQAVFRGAAPALAELHGNSTELCMFHPAHSSKPAEVPVGGCPALWHSEPSSQGCCSPGTCWRCFPPALLISIKIAPPQQQLQGRFPANSHWFGTSNYWLLVVQSILLHSSNPHPTLGHKGTTGRYIKSLAESKWFPLFSPSVAEAVTVGGGQVGQARFFLDTSMLAVSNYLLVFHMPRNFKWELAL